jgi:hypothetical protein
LTAEIEDITQVLIYVLKSEEAHWLLNHFYGGLFDGRFHDRSRLRLRLSDSDHRSVSFWSKSGNRHRFNSSVNHNFLDIRWRRRSRRWRSSDFGVCRLLFKSGLHISNLLN